MGFPAARRCLLRALGHCSSTPPHEIWEFHIMKCPNFTFRNVQISCWRRACSRLGAAKQYQRPQLTSRATRKGNACALLRFLYFLLFVPYCHVVIARRKIPSTLVIYVFFQKNKRATKHQSRWKNGFLWGV